MPDVGDRDRIGNPAIDPSTGLPLSVPPDAFTTNGQAVDPTEVTLTIRQPNGAQLVYGWPTAAADGTLVQESAGRFYADVTYDRAGYWHYRLAGSGAVVAAEEGFVLVNGSKVLG